MISVEQLTVVAVLHVATQQCKINFFSKFLKTVQIRRAMTIAGVIFSFQSGTKVSGSAMGRIRQLFDGNKCSFQRVNRPGNKGDNPLSDKAQVKSAFTCQYLLTSRCPIQHNYNKILL